MRKHQVNWQSYLQSQMIGDEDFKIIQAYDQMTDSESRQAVLQNSQEEVITKTSFNNIVTS